MSTDSSWGDYLSADTSVTDYSAGAFDPPAVDPVVEPVLPEPVLDVVETELTGAAADQDWSSWHAESGDQWANSAQDWVDYANENLAAGNVEIADSALAHAADHAAIADGNYDVSLDYSAQAGSHLDTAAAEVAPYDTTSYDSTSYDPGPSFDAGTSLDIAE